MRCSRRVLRWGPCVQTAAAWRRVAGDAATRSGTHAVRGGKPVPQLQASASTPSLRTADLQLQHDSRPPVGSPLRVYPLLVRRLVIGEPTQHCNLRTAHQLQVWTGGGHGEKGDVHSPYAQAQERAVGCDVKQSTAATAVGRAVQPDCFVRAEPVHAARPDEPQRVFRP